MSAFFTRLRDIEPRTRSSKGSLEHKTSSVQQHPAVRSDVEAQGAQLLAALGGDLVRSPRRQPHPLDADLVSDER